MNQEENEKRVGRTLSPPFLIQMISSEHNKHCDLYNHGSIHKVRTCKEGFVWVDERIDAIPNKFPFQVLAEKPETKTCPSCKNEFVTDWPFVINKGELTCTRCYERSNVTGDRDMYRDAVHKEFIIQTNLNKK